MSENNLQRNDHHHDTDDDVFCFVTKGLWKKQKKDKRQIEVKKESMKLFMSSIIQQQCFQTNRKFRNLNQFSAYFH